ncbi:hypothetical protein FB451DRAFT_1172671 [Mycena latifolia]|nr:hypothetical protein FB451DRAFT_1172671 [Mycena latifolia]
MRPRKSPKCGKPSAQRRRTGIPLNGRVPACRGSINPPKRLTAGSRRSGALQVIMASPHHTPLSSLEDWIHEVVGQVFSLDDAVSEAALTKFWSPHFQDSDVATGKHYNLTGFRDVIHSLRTQLPGRTLVKETIVVATPADPSNRTGAAGTTHVYSAVKDGHAITGTCIAVVQAPGHLGQKRSGIE